MRYFGRGKKPPASDAQPTDQSVKPDDPVDQVDVSESTTDVSQPVDLPSDMPPEEQNPTSVDSVPVEENAPPVTVEAPTEATTGKKSLFSRFRPQLKPQLPHISLPGRKPPPGAVEELPSDVAEVTQGISEVSVTNDGEAAAKLARRKQRRAERQKAEERWNEEYHERKRFAVINNLPMDEMVPLPDFTSESEDEADQPEIVAGPTPDQHHQPVVNHSGPHVDVVAEGVQATPNLSQGSIKGPFIPQSPSQQVSQDGISVVSATPVQGMQSAVPQTMQHDPRADAAMAEMLGAQAFSGSAMQQHPVMQTTAQMSGDVVQQQQMSMQQQQMPMQQQPAYTRAPTNPTPIGWGGVYSEVPSQPMFGMPMHLSRNSRGPLDIDPMLAEKIRRGRELATLAIEQEASGNLGAAENGYMKALELLVPASKELDVGSEFNKNVRLQQKAKIQRECAAMLDRCEQLRLFLRANGAAIPKELPKLPSVKPGRGGGGGGGGGGMSLPPPPQLPNFDADVPRGAHAPEMRDGPGSGRSLPPNRPPPPAPPSFSENSDDLLSKLTNRHNVLSAASQGVLRGGNNPDISTQAPMQKPRGSSGAKCFMCNAPAELRAKCDQTFCGKCGNQAASVFGRCPDPSCGKAFTTSEFVNI